MTQEFTNLIGVKWSKSTLLKALEQQYTRLYQQLVKDETIPWSTKNEMINTMLRLFLPIYKAVYEYGVIVKKK